MKKSDEENKDLKRILVVEDHKDIAMLVEKRLSKTFAVELAFNGEDASDLLNDKEFDLVILDLSLPKKSGFDVLKDLRKKSSFPPVLILSGLNAVDDKVKGLKLGADDYLAKPFDMKELMARIEALLRRVPTAAEVVKLDIADLEMDLVGRKVLRGGKEIELSRRNSPCSNISSGTKTKSFHGNKLPRMYGGIILMPVRTLSMSILIICAIRSTNRSKRNSFTPCTDRVSLSRKNEDCFIVADCARTPRTIDPSLRPAVVSPPAPFVSMADDTQSV